LGALLGHITGGADAVTYQPMNVNFGLFPPVEGKARKADRKRAYTKRAEEALAEWLANLPPHGEAMGRGTRRSLVEGHSCSEGTPLHSRGPPPLQMQGRINALRAS
jgi:hypothetical protein